MGGEDALQPVELNVATFILQQCAALWMLTSIMKNLLRIMKSAKGYGSLMWWCTDLEAKWWFLSWGGIQSFHGDSNGVVVEFCRSLVPYLFVSRGPVVAIALEWLARKMDQDFDAWNNMGGMVIAERYATGVLHARGDARSRCADAVEAVEAVAAV